MDELKDYFLVNGNNVMCELKDCFLVNGNNDMLSGRVKKLFPG
jgi:hypothetical protein